jgi:hypothetical protein
VPATQLLHGSACSVGVCAGGRAADRHPRALAPSLQSAPARMCIDPLAHCAPNALAMSMKVVSLLGEFSWLALGGVVVGLAAGYLTS